MTDTTYLEALVEAVNEIYQKEQKYFDEFKGCEQAAEFRIAHRMANLIEPMQHDVHVDCEVRKCNGRLKVKRKRPDIVVHKRQITSYMVVEIKCNNDESEWRNDFEKLELFTLLNKPEIFSTNVPTYELGAFVYLADKLSDVKFRIYENGIDTTENYLNGILKGFGHAEI